MRATAGLLCIVAALAGGCGHASTFGPTTEELLGRLDSPDPDVRREAIAELSEPRGGREGKFPELYATFTADEDATVRSAALRALGRCEASEQMGAVTAALDDEVPAVRRDAAVALDSVIADEAVEPLSRAALEDPSIGVRVAAVRALRHYRRPGVLATLMEALDDPEFSVRHQAGRSLAELTGEDAGTDARRWRRILAEKEDPFAPRPKEKPWWRLW